MPDNSFVSQNSSREFLRLKIAFVLTALGGCFQVINSTSNDDTRFKSAGETKTGSVRFLAANAVIAQKCATCHTSTVHETWGDLSEADWVARASVVPGDPTNSALLKRLKNNGGDMPQGAAALSETELAELTDWISNIDHASTGGGGGSGGGGNGAAAAAQQRFQAVRVIIANQCLGCHGTGSINTNFTSTDERTYTAPLVVNGSPATSEFYKRLTKTPGDSLFMPQGGSPLNASDLQAISDWITNKAQ